MISLKPGVGLDDLCPQMVLAITIAEGVWALLGIGELVVTSVNDGVHAGGARPSLHPLGRAADLRTQTLAPGDRAKAAADLAHRLGPEFDVLHEGIGTPNEHIHIQWDPPA